MTVSASTRSAAVFVAAVLAFIQLPPEARADVVISTLPTKNMICAAGVCAPTAKNAVLNVSDLMAALNAGNLEVTTGSAGGKQSGGIVVEASFHWASNYALTLDTFHSIRVNQPVTDAGAGALTLTTSDGGTNGHLQFGAGGNIGFWGVANALTINGQAYTLVNSVASLAAAVSANPSGNYALSASSAASVKVAPGPLAATFNGSFDGLGNTISNISIRARSAGDEGFFGEIGTGASVSNFRLRNAIIIQQKGRYSPNALGVLAGGSSGTLYGDEVSGAIVFSDVGAAGGLVGAGGGSIAHCSSNVAMITPDENGGAVFTGGLAGTFSGSVTDSVSTGNVAVGYVPWEPLIFAGGLLGEFSGAIRHSHATGHVAVSARNAQAYVGGLVGEAKGSISSSYATGDVEGGEMVGGLVGMQNAALDTSFAGGSVSSQGAMFIGGLVGALEDIPGTRASIANSYATGAVAVATTGSSGGLVGAPYSVNGGTASSYSTGKVTAQFAGGFAGVPCGPYASNGQCFSNDYWDITTSGLTKALGAGSDPGVSGETTTQLKSGLPAGFNPKVWAEDKKINHGFPYLIANPPPH